VKVIRGEAMDERIVFDWEAIERWRKTIPELVEKIRVGYGDDWKKRVVDGALLMAFQKTIAIAEAERDQKRQLQERIVELETEVENYKAYLQTLG
jgi:hypothetical protein